MIDSTLFDPVISIPILLLVMVVMTITFIVLEWKKPLRYRGVRVAAVVVFMVGVTALFIRPQRMSTKSSSIVIVTNGYIPRQLDSLKKIYPDITVASLNSTLNDAEITLASDHDLESIRQNIRFVLGYGFSPAALDIMRDNKFIHLPSTPEGILLLDIPDNIHVNQQQVISGLINTKDPTKLVLAGPQGKIDSTVATKGTQRFNLSFSSKQEGNFVYTISTGADKYSVPIVVHPKSKLNVLLLQQYPTFETRSLKEYLAKDHSITARYELSKNIHRFENINRPKQEFNRISSSLLDNFDLLIIDGEILERLSPGEWKSVEDELQKGLGLILLANNNSVKSKRLHALGFSLKEVNTDTAVLSLNKKQEVLSVIPFSISSSAGTTGILKNKNRIVTAYRSKGFGKAGLQLIQDSYKLKLKGDSVLYESLWLGLIENIARKTVTKNKITINQKFPIYPDEPVSVDIISADENPVLKLDSIRVPLIEDKIIDGLWSGKIWFDAPGWKTLIIDGDSLHHPVFVSESTQHSSLDDYKAIQDTKKLSAITKVTEPAKSAVPVNPVIFYLMILFAAATLWLTPKL